MECGSCGEVIPDDSIFCPECGSRQELSRAGSFTNPTSIGLSGQEVSGGRNFGVVSGEAVRQQRDMNMGSAAQIPPEVLQQIAMGIQQNGVPPGQFPPQPLPNQMGQFPPQPLPNQMGQFPPQGMPPQGMPPQGMPPQGMPPQGIPQQRIQPQGLPQLPSANVLPTTQSDLPQQARGPSLSSGAVPQIERGNVTPFTPGGTMVANNPAASPTDAMVNRLAEAERAMKDERRSQWLNMNQSPATNVLASLGAELPSHLRGQDSANPAQDLIAGALGQGSKDAPNEALLRRMCEVAVRRVARKRGVAVETPQAKVEGDLLQVNVTYVDDGRVLDTPEDLMQAFEHAIQTEVALKGFDLTTELNIFRSKDGQVENLGDDSSQSDEEMFACEICDGLVKESDSECPHCGAVFEDEEEEEPASTPRSGGPPKRSGPPGPSKGGPPKKSGPPGPSKGGPPKKSGPPGPSKGGPPKKSGPPGPSKGGPPKKNGPPGPSKGGPPKKSGPPGPSKGGPPKKSGPPGPSKGGPSGGPPKKGGPPGPSKGGPSGGPPKKGGPPGPSKGGPSGGPPKKSGPPGPKRGPPR